MIDVIAMVMDIVVGLKLYKACDRGDGEGDEMMDFVIGLKL